MAQRGLPVFDTENPDAPNSHARLLEVAAVIKDDVQLAAHFRTTVPTVRKWRALPLGYKPGKPGGETHARKDRPHANQPANPAQDGNPSEAA